MNTVTTLGFLPRPLRERPAILISVAAVCVATLAGMLLVLSIGVSIPQALAAFAEGAWGTPYAVAASINRALALGLVGIGFVLAQRANLTNVGGEGQIALGGITATAVALYGHVDHLPMPLPFVLPMLAAALAGGVWGGGRGGHAGSVAWAARAGESGKEPSRPAS